MMQNFYRLFIHTIGWRHLVFAIIILSMTFTEHLLFHVPYNSGWWSLHTNFNGIFSDAWHFFKNLTILYIIIYGYINKMLNEYAESLTIDLLIYGVIAWICHDPFLHHIYPAIL